MNKFYIYPGSFCPPTYGHLAIVKKMAAALPELTIICSRSQFKEYWFSPEECLELWSAYDLPANVTVRTFDEFATYCLREGIDPKNHLMVRGLRNLDEFADEKRVMKLNYDSYGIESFAYFFADPGMAHISSTKVREAAKNLDFDTLRECAAPLVISALLEKTLSAKNVFLVTGRPGTGKTTFLNLLKKYDPATYAIHTDNYNHQFREMLANHFGTTDLIKLVVEHNAEVSAFLKEPWLNLLKEDLRKTPAGSNIYIEAAYALAPTKMLFQLLGGKIIDFVCAPERTQERIIQRGTPYLAPLVATIPDSREAGIIATNHRLECKPIWTDCSLAELEAKAQAFAQEINR